MKIQGGRYTEKLAKWDIERSIEKLDQTIRKIVVEKVNWGSMARKTAGKAAEKVIEKVI